MSISKSVLLAFFVIAITCHESASFEFDFKGRLCKIKQREVNAEIDEEIIKINDQMIRYLRALNQRNSILQSNRSTAKVNSSNFEALLMVANHVEKHEFSSECEEQASAHRNLIDSFIKSANSCANEKPAFISPNTSVYDKLLSQYKSYINESLICLDGITWDIFYNNVKVLGCIENVEGKFHQTKQAFAIPDGRTLASKQQPVNNMESCPSSPETIPDAIRVSEDAVWDCLDKDVRRQEKSNLREENTTTSAEDTTTQGGSTQDETEAVPSQETRAPGEENSGENEETT